MGKAIATTDCIAQAQGGYTGPPAVITYTGPTCCKTGGSKILMFGEVSISLTGVTGKLVENGSGQGKIQGTGLSVKSKGKNAILEGDSTQITLTGVNPDTGASGATAVVEVKIVSAGQIKVITK